MTRGNGERLTVKEETRFPLDGKVVLTLTPGKKSEFTLRLRPGELGPHVDFVLHNAGSHVCDATALRIRALANVQQFTDQVDVTDSVQAQFHNRLVTPLGRYSELFGGVAPGADNTLKVKFHYWRDGVMKYLEFPADAALDLTGR